MAKLAIKGHATRGNEVIELLAMLGGNNAFGNFGNNTAGVYCVEKSYKNYITCSRKNENNIIFTLEEFIENFPYKVGDEVLINNDENDVYTVKSMEWDENFNRVVYKIEAVDGIMDNHTWFAHEMVFFNHKKRRNEERENSVVVNIEHKQLKIHSLRFDKTQLIINDEYELVQEDNTYYIVHKII